MSAYNNKWYYRNNKLYMSIEYKKTYITVKSQEEYEKAINFYFEKWFTWYGWWKWTSQIPKEKFSEDFIVLVDDEWVMWDCRKEWCSINLSRFKEIYWPNYGIKSRWLWNYIYRKIYKLD